MATVIIKGYPNTKTTIKLPKVSKKKTVFLTFDDGIQPGTKEILKVLVLPRMLWN